LGLFVHSAMDEWPTFVIVDGLPEDLANRPLAKARRFVQIRDEAAAEEPQIVDVPPNRLRRQLRGSQLRDERPEAGHQFLARRQVFSHPIHERGQSPKS
jgi:hypothetical protein